MAEVSKAVELGLQTWPLCLPNAPDIDPNHLQGDSVLLVGYGPETTESTKVNQIRQKVDPQWACEGLYNFENAAVADRDFIKFQVERDLPNMFIGKICHCCFT